MGRGWGILALVAAATLVAGAAGQHSASASEAFDAARKEDLERLESEASETARKEVQERLEQEAAEARQEEQERLVQEAANQGISIMLLGSVGFMMGIFYLVNFKDEDIIKYTWQVISSTISIFSAVLLFQAVNGVVEEYFTEGASIETRLLVAVVHMLVWFGLLQFVLAWISGAIGNPIDEDTEEFENMELNLKCWAVLFGHITGFAAINAFAILQQMVPRNLLATFLVAPLAWLSVYVLGLGTEFVRYKVAMADDGKEDMCEKKWDEETKETEDDIIGLAVSFIFAQFLRFFVSGELPDEEGSEPDQMLSNHSNGEVLLLVGISVLFTVMNVLRTMFIKGKIPNLERLTLQMRNIVMMDFAWCFFFSADWWVSTNFFAKEHGMIKEVILALFVTAVAFIMIFFLDTLGDHYKSLDASDVDQALRAVVQAYGILIGFSWEKAFDVAVEECTEFLVFMNAAFAKLMLAVILAAVVIPAWRLHILPNIMDMEALEEEEEKEEHEREERAIRGDLEDPLITPEEMEKDEKKKAEKGLKKFKAGLSSMSSADLKKKTCELKVQLDVLTEEHSKLKETHPNPENHGGHHIMHHPDYHHMHRIQELEKRNSTLEQSLSEIKDQLNELHELADLLST